MSDETTSDPSVGKPETVQPEAEKKPSGRKGTARNRRPSRKTAGVDPADQGVVVAFVVPPDVLARLDEIAAEEMRSRAAQVLYFISKAVKSHNGSGA